MLDSYYVYSYLKSASQRVRGQQLGRKSSGDAHSGGRRYSGWEGNNIWARVPSPHGGCRALCCRAPTQTEHLKPRLAVAQVHFLSRTHSQNTHAHAYPVWGGHVASWMLQGFSPGGYGLWMGFLVGGGPGSRGCMLRGLRGLLPGFTGG